MLARLRTGEWLMTGGLLALVATLFLDWFTVAADTQLAHDMREGSPRVQRLLGDARSHAASARSCHPGPRGRRRLVTGAGTACLGAVDQPNPPIVIW